jgi:hypothetical protein
VLLQIGRENRFRKTDAMPTFEYLSGFDERSGGFSTN